MDRFLPGEQKITLAEALKLIRETSETLNLDMTLLQIPRLEQSIADAQSYGDMILPIQELRMRMHDELKSRLFLYVPQIEARFYDVKQAFGPGVDSKFPNAISDIEESGNCIALGRSTAAVFHLMRVMELGVQSFGSKIGVANTTEKNWQNILDELNKKVKSLPEASLPEKELKARYATVSANLFNVKIAWRNSVMHPRASYTPEEAADIYDKVRTFMKDLAETI